MAASGRIADGNPDAMFVNVASLAAAGATEVTFYDERRSPELPHSTSAGACVIRSDQAHLLPPATARLIVDDPYLGFALIAQVFYPTPARAEPVIHDRAIIDPSARIADGCRIDAGVVIGADADIGQGTWIEANAVVGAGVVIGQHCIVGTLSSLSHAVIGNGVIIYPGARIGQDGFGYAQGPEGHVKLPQLGRVVIEDGVEVGANSTIDRGTLGDTLVRAGTKIDNLVQIGHNVRIGLGCAIAGQVGLSGSTILGDFVMMGGQAGSAGHLTIGNGARVAAQAGLMRDVPPGETVVGTPAVPSRQGMRQFAAVARLAKR